MSDPQPAPVNMSDPKPAMDEARIQAAAKVILEHFRNLLMCATLLALGLVARSRPAEVLGGSLIKGFTGWGVITLAAGLAIINLWAGVDRLRHWKHWRLWCGFLLGAYALLAARVIEVMALIHLEGK